MIADEVVVVSDQELRDYESTGRKMTAPKVSEKVRAMRVANAKAGGSVKAPASASKPSSTVTTEKPRPLMDPPVVKKLFVHVKDPDDHETLLRLKQLCSEFPGVVDIVLVLGADKTSAIKLPFRVASTDDLMGALVKLLGEDAVALK